VAIVTDAARFGALRHRDCRYYLIGSMLSMMADNIEHVISYWVMFQVFRSPALAGFAVVSHWLPSLLLSVYFGSLADRYDCRKLIQIAQGLFMANSAIWGILFWTDSLQLWHAVVLLIIHGLAVALWAPAGQIMLHDIVGREQLASAVRLNSTFRSLGFLVGPGIGSALLLGLGETLGIFVNVLIYLPLTVWLALVPYTGHLRQRAGARKPELTIRDAIRTLGEVRGNPIVVSMIVLGGVSSLFIGAALGPQMPEFAHDLGVDKAGFIYGALLAANAAGAVIGGLLLESTGALKPNARTAMVATGVMALAMIGFALSTNYLLSLALLVAAGVCNLASTSIGQTLVQLLAPAEQRGRVVGVYNMSSSGLRAGSGITIGVLGSFVGIHWSLGISAATLGLVVLGLLLYTSRTRLETTAAIEPVSGVHSRAH
jgi:MFS family permease